MSSTRSVEDRLRAEYFKLLPALQRTLTAVETEVRHELLESTLKLNGYERILVKARVKECESAVDSLRRRQESRGFDPDQPDRYSLTSLPDLVGVRVLTFPQRRREDARLALASRISAWTADPLPNVGPSEGSLALKYHGRWLEGDTFDAEIQIVSMLIGLFWEVEHSAIYKPSPDLRGVAGTQTMRDRTKAVHTALMEFEREFDRQIGLEPVPEAGKPEDAR